jgi:uncharacterized protein YbjT (DUF2867 family)
MQKPTILVTGATGKTGAATTLQLLEKGYPFVRWCGGWTLAASVSGKRAPKYSSARWRI